MIDRSVFDLSLGEIAVVGLLILVFFDVDQLPGLMRQAGRMYAKVRGASNELTRAFNSEVARAEADQRREQMERRREATIRESGPREDANRLRSARANAPARPPPDDAVMRPRPGSPAPGPVAAEPTSSGDPRVDPAAPAPDPTPAPSAPSDPSDSGGAS